MKYALIFLKIILIIAVITVVEFIWPQVNLVLAPVLILLLAIDFWRKKQVHWLYIASLVLIPFPEFQAQVIGPLEIHHTFLLVTAAYALWQWLRQKPKRLPLLTLLIIIFLLLITGLTLINFSEIVSWHRLFILFFMFLIAILAPFVITTLKKLKGLYWAIFGAGLLTALVALASLYFAIATDTYFGDPYLHISIVEGVPRLAGTLLDSNFLGHFLLLILPASFGLLVLGFKKVKTTPKILFVLSVLLLSGTFLLTYSRSSYLGMIAALIVLGLALATQTSWLKKVGKLLGWAVLGIVVATLLYPVFPFFSIYRTPTTILPSETKEQLLLGFDPTRIVNEYRERIQNDPTLSEEERESILARDVSSDSLGYRITFWQAGLQMFRDHPWTGVGVGQFRYQFKNYNKSEFLSQPDAHNIYIELLAETGVAGLALFVVILIIAFRNLIKIARNSRGTIQLAVAAILASLVGVLVQSSLLGGLGAFSIYLLLGLATALPLLAKRTMSAKKTA